MQTVTSSIQKAALGGAANKQTAVTGNESAGANFADTFRQALGEVNQSLTDADKKMSDLATGQNRDIHGTMIAMQKAEVSLRLMINVRNKVVAAYQEVSRMQI